MPDLLSTRTIRPSPTCSSRTTCETGETWGSWSGSPTRCNGSLKCAKATVDDDAATVRFNMEWFQEDLPSAQLFERALSQLAAAAAQFFEKLGTVEPVKALA